MGKFARGHEGDEVSRSRVLLVEDEFLIRLIMAEALADDGLDVVDAPSGDAAAALLDGPDGFDLLLTDMQMPGRMDGAALARHARERHPDIAVVYMTGRPDVLGRLGLLGKRETVLHKPFGMTEALVAVHRLLERR